MRRVAEHLGFGLEGTLRGFMPTKQRAARLPDVRHDERRLREGEGWMELDRLTIKSQSALQEAHQQASARHHQQIEPEHVLYALLTDPEGVVFPLLHQLGVVPKQLRDKVDEALDAEAEGLRRRGAGRPVAGDGAPAGGGRPRGRAADGRVHLDRASSCSRCSRATARSSACSPTPASRATACWPRSPRSAAVIASRRRTRRRPSRRSSGSGETSPSRRGRASSIR